MRKVARILLAGTIAMPLVLPVAIHVAKGEPVLRLAQAPLTEEQKKKQQQQKPPTPPAQRPQAPPPQPPHPPQAAPAQPPHPPQAPAQVQPPPHAPPPRAPAQVQPPPHQPPANAPAQVQPPANAPAQVQPPPHQPPANAPVQNQPPRRQAPPNAPAQNQPMSQPPTNAPAQVQPPPHQPPANAPAQNQPPRRQAPAQNQPQTAPTQAAPAVVPRQQPPSSVAPPPPALPPPTATQARPLQRTQGPAAITPTSQQGQPVRRVDQLRSERHEVVEGNRTIIREQDRMIVREANGRSFIRHDDVDRFRYGARDVRVETRGNDNVTTVVLPNGQRVVTVLDADGRLMRRSRFLPDGRELILIDQRPIAPGYNPFVELPPPIIRIPRERYIVDLEGAPPALIYDTLMAPPVEQIDQAYSLDQIRDSYSLRERMPSIDIDTVNFETGSWEVAPDQVDRLAGVADGMNRAIQANPQEVFMIEGHTDAVGNDVDNLSLSDRRAETVALILSDKFGVPPENLVTQGYGEQFLKIPTDGPERRNRRVTVRRITPLLGGGPQAGGLQR